MSARPRCHVASWLFLFYDTDAPTPEHHAMSAVDELVRQWMAKVEASGEMRSAAGKPLPLGDGSEQVPESLRLAYKALKNAGYVPDEVAMMRKVADLRAKIGRAHV